MLLKKKGEGMSEKKKTINAFMLIVLLFGLISLFAAYPLSNGDEGFHMAKSYSMFSETFPRETSEKKLREIELIAISQPKQISIRKFYGEKIKSVANDGIKFNVLTDQNLTSKIDVGHFIPAIGLLIGRIVYPSYGVMLFSARLFNLIFFLGGMYLIFRRAKFDHLIFLMIFTVPFMQKIASPSYDIFAFLAVAAFGTNFLYLSQLKKVSDVRKEDVVYTVMTIALILLTKLNYIFALPVLLGIPIVYNPILSALKRCSRISRVLLAIVTSLLFLTVVLFVHRVYNIPDLIKVFFNNYFNVATMGGRGATLFSVVQDNLPEIVNICWIVCLVLVMMSTQKSGYRLPTALAGLIVYLLNWFGIFLGFYSSHPEHFSFDDLTGRYLHAYIIFLIPLMSWLGMKMNFKISPKAKYYIAIFSTSSVLILYLITIVYRGFILGITPAWKN